ncbi:MAG: DUF4389 domain-containing protein [Chloroflexi bacterium]|nr:MAG: DUF4389 domain-containing protein [Chloroflexota bacterium]
MTTLAESYPARLNIDYPEKLDRLTTLLRVIWIIPIAIVLSLISATGNQTTTVTQTGERVMTGTGGGIAGGLFLATVLMIVFRVRYPRWWFDFARELTRFGARVGAYFALLTDRYPSTVEEQTWLPLIKWLMAIPHLIVLIFLALAAFVLVVVAWFAILITGRYPRWIFDFVVGVGRWGLRVNAYAFLLVTDRYPPFSLS